MVGRRLGRGLEFFLSGGEGLPEEGARRAPAGAGDEVVMVEVGALRPSEHQPRQDFDEGELDSLAASIRASGVLQPILVRRRGEDLEIVAGERRWRAAQRAGLDRVPALVRDIDDEAAAVFGLVENVHRADLNAIEKARAIRRLLDLTKARQEELAGKLGLDRSTVANLARLLELPDAVQEHVSRGTLTMGHARALLGLPDPEEQVAVAEEILRRRLSVREVEALVRELRQSEQPKKPGDPPRPVSGVGSRGQRPIWLDEIEGTLREALGTQVTVKYGRKRSRIVIECLGREEFERVYELLKSLDGEG